MEAARPATEDDREAIVRLARQAIAELSAGRGGAMWRRTLARQEPLDASIDRALARAASDDDQQVLVGTYADAVVGYGVLTVSRLGDGDPLATVEDVYVEPEARGVGVGEAIMDEMLRYAEARDCVGIDALALPGDRHTKNFFERFGLTARAIVVHRSLRPEDPIP